MRIEFSGHIFKKQASIKYNEHHSSVSQVVPCGRTDMTTQIFAFRDFAWAPKNRTYQCPLMRFKPAHSGFEQYKTSRLWAAQPLWPRRLA